MPPVGGSSTSFRLYGQWTTVHDGGAQQRTARSPVPCSIWRAPCETACDCSICRSPEALPLATTAPAAFLGIAGWLGRLAPGYRADLVALDPDTVDVFATWAAGTPSVTG
jgi:N-acetylglucosamine-6-phosphate deacetylase